jgi:hypothetical protein
MGAEPFYLAADPFPESCRPFVGFPYILFAKHPYQQHNIHI